MLLRCFGARIGRTVWVHPSVRVAVPWKLEIGEDSSLDRNVHCYNHHGLKIGRCCVVSREVFLCTTSHDYTVSTWPVIGSPIRVEDDAWLCADAFVGPGVTIGQGAVVGARGVVFRDVQPWAVMGGNPAKLLKWRSVREPGEFRGDDRSPGTPRQ